jgi:ABC-type dipeptide/oligopeptide/nickel transport system permease component
MSTYITRRILAAIPVLVGVLIITFGVTRFTPGDPAEIMAGLEASDEAIQSIREELGLDQPVITQFFIYVSNVLQGDLGRSYYLGRDVTTLIAEALPRTAQLAAVALVFTVLIGVPLGILSAVRKDSWLDLGSRSTALFGVSIPPFFAGLLAILIFSHYFRVFPSFGSGTWQHLVLPGISLALFSAGLVMRLTRSAMLEVLHENYIRTARAKGLTERTVLWRHALRNAAIPIITIMGLQLGSLLAGAVLTETVFGYPGIGRMLARSVFERDFPVTQGLILLIALIYVLVNVLVDILYSVLDPRIRYE